MVCMVVRTIDGSICWRISLPYGKIDDEIDLTGPRLLRIQSIPVIFILGCTAIAFDDAASTGIYSTNEVGNNTRES